MTKPTTNMVQIYVDGSCLGNPGPMGIGVVFARADNTIDRELSEFLGPGTNNVAELRAIERGLTEALPQRSMQVAVYSDSEYAIGVLDGSKDARTNLDVIARIQQLMAQFDNLHLQWLRGHSGNAGNERANKLAQEAAAQKPRGSCAVSVTAPAKQAAPPAPAPPAVPAPAPALAPASLDAAIRKLLLVLCKSMYTEEELALVDQDCQAIQKRYGELKSLGKSFEDSAMQARHEWLREQLALLPQARAADALASCARTLETLLAQDLPIRAEAHARQAYKLAKGPDPYNDRWLDAYATGGIAAVRKVMAEADATPAKP